MRNVINRRTVILRLAACLLAASGLGACSDGPASKGSGNANVTAPTANVAAPAAPGGTGMPGNMPAPLGMEDSIEGRVVAVLCYEKNPNMPAAEAKACAESTSKQGGALAVLGDDGVLYINDEKVDIRRNNKQFEFFIGEIVTVQGQLIGDATRPKIGSTPVKQFRMKLVRRKKEDGAGPVAAPAAPPAATNKAAGR